MLRNETEVEKQVHIVIPEGTKVLTRPGGRVGIVAHAPSAPEHSYRVRFADGGPEESFRRVDLTIFKHVQDEVPGGPDVTDLYRFVIYRCVVGSTAYGLSQEGSDMDRRGFYLPPVDLEWSLASVPEQLERTMKKFTGKSRSSFDSPSKRIRTSWSASTRHSLKRARRWPRS
jgi:hypothetical protein